MISAATQAPTTRRLVIVEDESVLALDIERHLTRAGFDVRGVAADSEEAVRLVERERPDLVLMDIRLQGARDGIDTAAELKERFDVSVVYLTAHSDPKTMERAQRTEPMGYLLKPFKKPDLQNVVTIGLARSHSERTLRRREEALRITLSCIGEAIFTTDAGGTVTYLNEAAEQLVGPLPSASLAQPLSVLVPLRSSDGGALPDKAVRDALAHGRVELEGTMARADGPRSVVGTAAALRQGALSFGVVVALRDLTELLLARRQLEFAERLGSLGTLAAGVAHEVNNPLSVVLSNLHFALTSSDVLPAEVREALADAQDGALRVSRIIGELRTFSRPQAEPLRPHDLAGALSAALHFTRAHWRTTAGVVLDLQAVPPVMASPTRLAQVFVNLIINAVQAMQSLPAQGHSLRCSTSTDARGRAVLALSDTGPGIPEALRQRIFEPFFTTKPEGQGTGLGLAVSRSIIEQHGGHLEVGSGPGGVGTTFTVVLPSGQREAPAAPLRALWVGLPCAESDALARAGATVLPPADLARVQEAVAEGRPEVTLLALPEAEARLLGAHWPEPESRLLRVGDEEPEPGMVSLRRPFDVGALTAFVRRGEEG